MNTKAKLAALVIAAVAGFGCQESKETSSEEEFQSDILAQVGNETLSLAQFKEAMMRRRVGDSVEAKAALLDEMVLRLKQVARAKELKLDEDPEVVREYQNLLVSRLRRHNSKNLPSNSNPTEQEIQRYYNEHSQEFSIPARLRLARIFVATQPGLSAEKKALKRHKIEEVRGHALAEASTQPHFGSLAMKFSDDQSSKARGGDIGAILDTPDTWKSAQQIPLRAVLKLTEVGQVSEVIETEKGFYLFKLIEKDPAGVRAFASVRGKILSKLTVLRRTQNKEALESQATQGIDAKINLALLEKVESKPSVDQQFLPIPPGR